MTKKIQSVPFTGLLLTVYAVFFSVQFFFNFEGPGNPQSDVSYFSGVSHTGHRAVVANKGSGHSSSHTIRLNKRFHQENIPPCDVLYVDAPDQYVTPRTLGEYHDPFLSSFSPVHSLLRGPPVAA